MFYLSLDEATSEAESTKWRSMKLTLAYFHATVINNNNLKQCLNAFWTKSGEMPRYQGQTMAVPGKWGIVTLAIVQMNSL